MSIDLILYIAAAICFGLGAFKVAVGAVDTWQLGWCLLVITLIV